MISKTYLNQYSKIINVISYKVNKYLYDEYFSGKKYTILPSFYLRFLSKKTPFYSEIIMYKNNKKRVLHEPILELKYIQKFILHTILYKFKDKYDFDKCVTGFIPKENIVTNAIPHLNKVAIIKMDIKDFFSIYYTKNYLQYF